MKNNKVPLSEKEKSDIAYLKNLVRELRSENAKLSKKTARLEAKCETLGNRVSVLEKLKVPKQARQLSDYEFARRIAFLLNKVGVNINGEKGV
ncbi:hypothetical protein HCH_02831 [Hahella chejuensis KCTC 2396]|uniref:Uncharacterized protein n=1 Tax=Hahella chejuensis (strain KCTC 2396) TaxID=349521 RepID=Q2SIB5_HAHCH|nr:hypothetical protein [Hahella chejuensis]ABC29609.1 hypothetical protein HCH_02831 [Hahella chejuensis KCTC 2396]